MFFRFAVELYYLLGTALLTTLSLPCTQRGGGFTQAGVPQRFGRAIHFQIPTKLSAGIQGLRETAR